MFIVESISDCISFKSVSQEVLQVLPKEQSGWDQHQSPEEEPPHQELRVGVSPSHSPLHVTDEVGNIVGHLRSRSGSAVVVINQSVVQLSRHSDDHVIKIGIEALPLRHIHSVRGLVVVASQQIIHIGHTSGSQPDLGKIGRQSSLVCLLGLIHRVIGGVYVVRDNSISVVPLLKVILLVVVMCGIDAEHGHLLLQLKLLVALVEQVVVGPPL